MPKYPAQITLSLGANLTSVVGNPAETLSSAVKTLESCGAVIRLTSRQYHTPAFPAGNGPDYVNMAVVCAVSWSPTRTLEVLHEIEHLMGRERVKRWGQRTLDIDLVAYDDLVLPDAQTFASWRELAPADQMTRVPDQLILPHPRMQDRAFVLVPLAEIMPDWVHPVSGQTAQQLLDALPEVDKTAVRAL